MDGVVRVLVVDQDLDVLQRVPEELDREGFAVRIASSGGRALRELQRWLPHVAVLDARVDALAALREHDTEVHVLVTGIDEEDDRVAALRGGADDCVGRTCSPREIAARVVAVARRCEIGATTLDIGSLRIDRDARKVHVGDRVVEMPQRELDLLVHLASNPERTFSREQLLRAVWRSSSQWQKASTVTEHIRRIRNRIEDDPLRPRWLIAVRGVGYRFQPGSDAAMSPTRRWQQRGPEVLDIREGAPAVTNLTAEYS
ncbi:MAG TPA: response regulator transcription factor [Acidimicrobiales bacterium]|nr:response regulator transcription factor [Acidimicrobiales bacterium]